MMLVVRLWLQNREYRFARKTRNKILLRVAAAALMLGTYLAYMNLNWNAEFGVISDLWNPAKTYRQYGTTVGFTAVAKYMRLFERRSDSDCRYERERDENRRSSKR